MSLIQFTTTLHKFDKKGEKTGWTYLEISSRQAHQLKPNCKGSFRIKGAIDSYTFQKTALLPMGDGKFILPFNAALRKATGKKSGDKIKVSIEADDRKLEISADLMKCLKEDPMAMEYFSSLPKSHQNYYTTGLIVLKPWRQKLNALWFA
ncbi:MAG: YdeI/OmpD-associated family protein [Cytophagales bacterium]|nr:YdeI/OmpD-associated family protein [Cytophagales bacterium]